MTNKGTIFNKFISKVRSNLGLSFFSVALIFFLYSKYPFVTFYGENGDKDEYPVTPGTIVIDPGHGGVDPGKISARETLEKNINLAISLNLKDLLEKEGYKVVMTREADKELCYGKYSKTEDLGNRVDIINDSEPLCVISIHQNSYSDSSVHGAQVFYRGKNPGSQASSQSKLLAEAIQNELNISPIGNNRAPKSNSDYYLFTHTDVPIVIVECGFLSNPQDEQMLMDDNFQLEMAKVILKATQLYVKNG